MSSKDPAYNESSTHSELKSFSIELSKDLAQRLNKHIQLLKKLDSEIKFKQAWVEKAIEEKLQREKEDSHQNLEDEYLHFKINYKIHEAVKNQVNLIKKFRNSYSQKKWFLEALYEKLDRDEQQTRQLMQNMLIALSKAEKN